MNKFVFFNDAKQNINIHTATKEHGVICDMSPIEPLEERLFKLPRNTYPWVKQWSNGMILVSPVELYSYEESGKM